MGFAVLINKQKNRAMKRSLGLLLALTLMVGAAPMGGANAATPKIGSKCTKANQKIKVSNQSYLCSKSGKKLVWVKSKTPVVAAKKSASPTPSQSPSPEAKTDSTQPKTSDSAAPATPAEKKTNAPSPAPTKTSTAAKTPSPSPAPVTSSGESSSGSSAPVTAPSQEAPAPQASASPSASPSPSSSGSSAPISNVIETKPVSLNSPIITGIKNGDVPKSGQVLTCSAWKWDQVVAQTIVSWIAYPSNTGSDIIDPNLYITLSEAVALTESKLDISAANIEKISGNYLYCFAKGMTVGGLETTSIAAILLGK